MRDFTRQAFAIGLAWTLPLLPAFGAASAPAQPAKALQKTPAAGDASEKLRTETHLAREAYVAHNYEVAVQHYEQAAKLATNLPIRVRIKLLTNLGAAYREAKKLPEAKDTFKQAISLGEQNHIESDPSTQMAMRQYAVLLRKMGQAVDADLMEARASGIRAGGAPAAGDVVAITVQGPATAAPKINSGSGGPKTAADFTTEQVKEMLDKHPNEPTIYRALAYKYSSEKKWQDAINTLLDMKSKLPSDFAACRGDLIEYYAKGDRIEDAIEQCRAGIDEQPDNARFYLMLSNYQIASGDMKGTLDTYEKFLDKFPDDANFSIISSRVQSMKRDAESKQVQSASEPTMKERMYNWPDRYFPLKVFVASDDVQLSPGSSDAPGTGSECVQAACSAWNQATHGKVSFVLVRRAEDANIEVAFSPDPNMMENPSAAGIAQWSGRGEAPKVRITLLTTEEEKPIDGDRLLEATLHEFGHALGLSHSKSVEDVMYFSERTKPMTQLSGNDAQRVIVLYTR